MGSNRETKRDRISRKKKKKNKKSKTAHTNLIEDSRNTNVVLNRPLGGKIPELIRETLANISREKIVQLLFQVKEKTDHCYDFDISFWLQRFLDLSNDVNLIEAAYLIVNAGYIYERKVDLLYELVRRSAESSRNATESDEKKTQAIPKTRRKITRQAVSLHDRLYESEMLVKQFKQVSSERITELLSSAGHKVPSHYFKKWAEYKVWRQNHKKKMKNPVPYSTVCDDLHLHPAMWGLSCIEDFDYDDDLDTKRNYRMFTHHMEHRFNTVVPDVNFIMHFKVKDFIEAEEDEMEMKKILDLPPPPTREWPPFCRTSYSKEYAKETFNVDIGESAEDYIKKYVDLEDIVLERPTYEFDSDLLRHAHEARKNHFNENGASRRPPQDVIFEQLKRIMDGKSRDNTATNTTLEERNEMQVRNEAENADITVPSCENEINDDHHEYVDIIEETPGVEAAINVSSDKSVPPQAENCDQLNENPSNSAPDLAAKLPSANPNSPCVSSLPQNDELIERIAADLAKALKSNSPVNLVENRAEPNVVDPSNIDSTAVPASATPDACTHLQTKDASCIISENIKNNISDQIVIRVSVDEGIAFSDLDDVDKAMLSPVVELVDIFSPIKEEIISFEDFDFCTEREEFRNVFGIDERYLNCPEDFNLPLNILCKEPEMQLNILKLPEARLRRRVIFALPQEFEIYMVNRLKRKCSDRNDGGSSRMIKVFKLNEQNIINIHITPPTTPNREDDFLGFDESDISFSDILSSTLDSSISKLLSSTTNRSISRDSGIGLSLLSESQVMSSTIAESEECYTVEILTECNEDILTTQENANELSKVQESPQDITPVSGQAATEESAGQVIEVDDIHDNSEHPTESNPPESGEVSTEEIQKSKDGVADPRKNKSTEHRTVQESAQFEQNLYDKCANNDRLEKRTGEVTLMTERIQKWHRYLRPILAKSMERHHFDIFGIGTEIIGTFPIEEESVPNEQPVISLGNVMESRDPTFLSRYFLSMLQLTNAGNVDLKVHHRDPNKPTPLRDIQLKLLSRKRHSVAIEDDIGARVHSSRKRLHSSGDDSDTASENGVSGIRTQQAGAKRAPLAKISSVLNTKNVVSTLQFNKNISYGSLGNSSIAASKTSTPCATNVTASSHLKNVAGSSNSHTSNMTLSTYPSTSSSPIEGHSIQSHIRNPISATPSLKNIQIQRQDKLPSINMPHMIDTFQGGVSTHAVLCIYQNTPVEAKASSSNILDSRKKTLSSLEPISNELPPFSSIRKFNVAKPGREADQMRFGSPSGRTDSAGSLSTFSTPSPGANLKTSQSIVLNSSVVYPKLIRTQNVMMSVKDSRKDNDDMDSGIFSEFSTSENNSTGPGS